MSQSNPNNSDAVLGGQNPAPINAVILGGLDGAKQRLESESLAAKLQALKDGLKYGTDGINLALQALSDPTDEVKRLARKLLRNHAEEDRKAALLEHDPLSYFTTLADWRWEVYNPEVGIVDPENNAYSVTMANSGSRNYPTGYDLSQFQSLIKDPRIDELEALIFAIDPTGNYSFGVAMEAIIDGRDLFPNLRGLFIGDSTGDYDPEYKRSKMHVFDIKPLLEAFPNLEILQVFGRFDYDYTLECAGFRHENLKTLIIETAHLSELNLNQIGAIDLPNLEHFELWFGKWGHSSSDIINALTPILSGISSPKLKYLGLCSDAYTDSSIAEVLKTPLISQLAVLDFKMGTMTDKGVDYLLNSPDLGNLKYLNVYGNYLSEHSIVRLQQLGCPIDASNPYYPDNLNEDDYRSLAESRRWALHE